ncbi:MAG TPA: hemerythrin domain-containing protein [Steroidobacteraceae bacterium]|nr:hemerythrin domain-containing protein [Steroidobacteraceae bacterium]
MSTNAIDLLEQDHERVRKLLAELTETTNRATKTRTGLLEKIAEELRIHTQIEEEIFYPAFKDAGDKEFDRLNYEALEEHRAVEKLVLPDLLKTDPGTDQFAGRAKVLRELVEHHADEEESEMFPRARTAMSRDELETLGAQIQARKEALGEAH